MHRNATELHTVTTQLTADQLNQISQFLDQFDCSMEMPSEQHPLFFNYEEGSNAGCYMTLGETTYRCNAGDESSYVQAVKLYLSMLTA